MKLTEEKIESLKKYAEFGYSPRRIAYLLNIPKKDFLAFGEAISDENTEIGHAYRQGEALGELRIDEDLASCLAQGEHKAAEILDQRDYRRKIQKLRKELFGI